MAHCREQRRYLQKEWMKDNTTVSFERSNWGPGRALAEGSPSPSPARLGQNREIWSKKKKIGHSRRVHMLVTLMSPIFYIFARSHETQGPVPRVPVQPAQLSFPRAHCSPLPPSLPPHRHTGEELGFGHHSGDQSQGKSFYTHRHWCIE